MGDAILKIASYARFLNFKSANFVNFLACFLLLFIFSKTKKKRVRLCLEEASTLMDRHVHQWEASFAVD